jgi:hypothetical protein
MDVLIGIYWLVLIALVGGTLKWMVCRGPPNE